MSEVATVIADARRQAEAARMAADAVVRREVQRLCAELAAERRKAGLSQQDISDAVGVSRSQIANVEAGRGVSIETLVAYAAALGWTLRFGS